MKNFALIGNPVNHSISPELHNWVFDKLGLQANYTKFQCETADLLQVIDRLKSGELDGINITIPYKHNILSLLDIVTPDSQAINAANCVLKINDKLYGHNTDWIGFSRLLEVNEITIEDHPCLVIGAGGAARSVIYALLHKNAESITIVNQTKTKAELLIGEMNKMFDTAELNIIDFTELASTLKNKTVIINCTPIGLRFEGRKCPITCELIKKQHILIDLIYSPQKTKFLEYGRAIGAKTINGLDMLTYQGLESLDLWFREKISALIHVSELKQYLNELIANKE